MSRARALLVAAVAGGALVLGPAGLRPAASEAATWTGPGRVNVDRIGAAENGPAIYAEPTGRLHAVWVERVAGVGDDLRYAARPAGSSQWGSSARVALVTGAARSDPAVAVDSSGRVHVVWLEPGPSGTGVWHASRGPAETAWSRPWCLSGRGALAVVSAPALATDRAGNLHVLWTDASSGDPDIVHRRRDPDGRWTHQVRVNSETLGDQRDPAVTDTPSGELVAAWQDTRLGTSEIYAARLPQFGDVWWPDARLSSGGLNRLPVLASDSAGRVVALWLDEAGTGEAVRSAVLFAQDANRPFWQPDREAYRPTYGQVLDMWAAGGPGGVLVVAWAETRSDGSHTYAAPIASAEAWSPVRVDATRALVLGRHPRVAMDALDGAHLVWMGTARDGNTDVYGADARLTPPAYPVYVGQGWLQYVPREPNCGTDGYVQVACDGSQGPFMWPTSAALASLLGSYVTVRGSTVSEGECPHIEPTEVTLEPSPCPRQTGSITGMVTAGGEPLEFAEVTAAEETVVTGPSGRFFLDRVPAGTQVVTATTACTLVAAKQAVSVPKGYLAATGTVELVRGDVAHDGVIDLADLVRVGAAQKSLPPFEPPCLDVDGDGAVSIADMAMVAAHFGRRAPTPWEADAEEGHSLAAAARNATAWPRAWLPTALR